MSDSTDVAATRLLGTDVEYRRSDGMVVASSWGEFTGGMLMNPINTDENGAVVPSNPHVWTGTDAMGLGTVSHCANWTTPGARGTRGQAISTGAFWSDDGDPQPCGESLHLYCIQQMSSLP